MLKEFPPNTRIHPFLSLLNWRLQIQPISFEGILALIMASTRNVYLISLGCAKNLVDSETILGLIRERAYPIVARLEEADVVIINTCGCIQSSVDSF